MTKALLIASCGLLALIVGAKVFEQDVKPAPILLDDKCIEEKSDCAEIFMREVRQKNRVALA